MSTPTTVKEQIQSLIDTANATTKKQDGTLTDAVGSLVDGYGGSGLDASLFGIINEVKGTNIVTCDYVNKNEHNVEVKLSSDTVTDFSGVEVKCVGNNLLQPIGKGWFFGNASQGSVYSFETPDSDFVYAPNEYRRVPAYVLYVAGAKSIFLKKPQNVYSATCFGYTNYEDITDSRKLTQKQSFTNEGEIVTINTNTNYLLFMYSNYSITTESVVTAEDVFATFCLHDTDYEPYTEKTYTANADGTVDGVTSISPVMNLICDTEGVDISAKYYCVTDVEWHRFWDSFQKNGKETDYTRTFYKSIWNDDTFKPKYQITPTQADYMFCGAFITDNNQHIKDIDFSNTLSMNYAFHTSLVEHLGILDCRKCGQIVGLCHTATKLHTIEKIIPSQYGFDKNAFQSATALKNVLFEGTINVNISFQWSSLLSVESAKSIIRHLKNYAGTDKDMVNTISFHANVWTLLDAEGNASPNGNTWKNYITEIGWNWN